MLDASAVVDFVLRFPRGSGVGRELRRAEGVGVPQHFDLEAMSALRKLESRGVVDGARARRAVRAVLSLRARRHDLRPLTTRIWQLRTNMTVYDAAYVALAATIGGTLVTTDPKWAGVPHLGVPLIVLS